MKNILVLIIILIVIIGGYLLFNTRGESTNLTVEGVVREVDLEQITADGPALITIIDDTETTYTIAVPSMGIRLCDAYENIASVADISIGDRVSVSGQENEGGEIVPCESSDHFLRVVGIYQETELGYQFPYLKGPNGYIIIDDEEAHGSNFISGIILFNRNEYEESQNTTDAREGPGAIHIRTYRNIDRQSPSVWALRNPQETNYELALSEPTEVVVGGANAINFTADGLWPIDTYVITHDSNIYLIMGMIPDDMNTMKEDFRNLVESFEFIQTEDQR